MNTREMGSYRVRDGDILVKRDPYRIEGLELVVVGVAVSTTDVLTTQVRAEEVRQHHARVL